MKVSIFKAACQTHRFRKNQKVWVREMCQNHMVVWYRFRGKNRYVEGTVDRWATCVGPVAEIDVDEAFWQRIKGEAGE